MNLFPQGGTPPTPLPDYNKIISGDMSNYCIYLHKHDEHHPTLSKTDVITKYRKSIKINRMAHHAFPSIACGRYRAMTQKFASGDSPEFSEMGCLAKLCKMLDPH